MSRPPKDKQKYLDSVVPRSKKKPRIQYNVVLGGTTASGWRSFKERVQEESDGA